MASWISGLIWGSPAPAPTDTPPSSSDATATVAAAAIAAAAATSTPAAGGAGCAAVEKLDHPTAKQQLLRVLETTRVEPAIKTATSTRAASLSTLSLPESDDKILRKINALPDDFFTFLIEGEDSKKIAKLIAQKSGSLGDAFHRRLLVYMDRNKAKGQPFILQILEGIWDECKRLDPRLFLTNGLQPYINVLTIYRNYYYDRLLWNYSRQAILPENPTLPSNNSLWIETLCETPCLKGLLKTGLLQIQDTENARMDFMMLLLSLKNGKTLLIQSLGEWASDLAAAKAAAYVPEDRQVTFLKVNFETAIATLTNALLDQMKDEDKREQREKAVRGQGRYPYYFTVNRDEIFAALKEQVAFWAVLEQKEFIAAIKECPYKGAFLEILGKIPDLPKPSSCKEATAPLEAWRALYS